MVRNQYSYWFEAKLNRAVPDPQACHNALLAELNNTELAMPAGFMVFETTANGVHGEVNPNYGTVEETSEAVDITTQIASKFPEYDIELLEHDEDNQSNQILTTYSHGVETGKFYARLIEPPTRYDEETVKAIAEYLTEKGFNDMAAEIRSTFQC